MQAASNPFNPGSGLRPPALVGREAELALLDVLIQRAGRSLPARGIMLTGLRGVGKTVLLNEMRDRAESAGWFVVALEARPDAAGSTSVRRILARDIAAQARSLRRGGALSERAHRALQSVSAFTVKLGTTGIDLGVDLTPGRADSGDIEVDLTELVADLSSALVEQGRAFALFIDELQDLDPGLLRALLVTAHQAGQRSWPFFLLGAGLPNLPATMATARSYSERLFDYRTIERLDDDQAAHALTDPVTGDGVSFEPTALRVLLQRSGGYPYFLQEYGRATWEVAAGPVITEGDARTGAVVALDRLDVGFFRSRWSRATPAERRLLVAMSEDGDGPSLTSALAERMGIKPNSLGPYRAKLIAKGLVFAPDHGMLAYTVPGMADFVHRHRDELA